MNKKIFVIIPSFNEEHSIGSVVKQVLQNDSITRCVVVDDHSADKTAFIAKKNGADVIRKIHNEGTGAAVRTGLRYAIQFKADMVVLMDADGQHDPKYIHRLLQKVSGSIDLVIGSRYVFPTITSTSHVRRVGTRVISCLLRLCYGCQITDPTSGFRALNRRAVTCLAKNYPTVFPEPEAILLLIYEGCGIQEVSTEMKPRKFGHSSIGPAKAMFLMMYIAVTILLTRLLRPIQRRNAVYSG